MGANRGIGKWICSRRSQAVSSARRSAAGGVQQHDALAVEQIVGHALHVPNADADFISVYLQIE